MPSAAVASRRGDTTGATPSAKTDSAETVRLQQKVRCCNLLNSQGTDRMGRTPLVPRRCPPARRALGGPARALDACGRGTIPTFGRSRRGRGSRGLRAWSRTQLHAHFSGRDARPTACLFVARIEYRRGCLAQVADLEKRLARQDEEHRGFTGSLHSEIQRLQHVCGGENSGPAA